MSFIGDALGGLIGGGGGGGGGSATSDPLRKYQGAWASKLNDLINNPSSVTSLPQYQFGLNQGTQAIQGSAAAAGMLNSGNTASALEKFGQDYAGSQYGTWLSQLGSLASGNPSYASIAAGQQQQAAGGIGSLLGGAFQGLGGFSGIGSLLGSAGSFLGNLF